MVSKSQENRSKGPKAHEVGDIQWLPLFSRD
jgi:hypothetical protein